MGSNYDYDLGCERAAGEMDVCEEVESGRNESGSASLNKIQGFEGVEFEPNMLVVG